MDSEELKAWKLLFQMVAEAKTAAAQLPSEKDRQNAAVVQDAGKIRDDCGMGQSVRVDKGRRAGSA